MIKRKIIKYEEYNSIKELTSGGVKTPSDKCLHSLENYKEAPK
jgi:hypothetical protein